MSKGIANTEIEKAISILSPTSVSISVHVKPNAKKSGIEWTEGQLGLKLNSPPVDNKANKEVCEVMSDLMDVPKGQISILRGQKSKDKEVLVNGITKEVALQRLVQQLS